MSPKEIKRAKYIPRSAHAAKWLDGARRRIISKDLDFRGYGNTAFKAMLDYYEITPEVVQEIVAESNLQWSLEDKDKLLHHVFILNGRPSNRQARSPNKMGIANKQGMINLLGELVNQIEEICAIFDEKNATNPNLKKYTVASAMKVARRNSPDEFATLLYAIPGRSTIHWVDEIVKRKLSVDEMLGVAQQRKRVRKRSKLEKRANRPKKSLKKYSYLDLIDEMRDDKGKVVIQTTLQNTKFKPRMIYELAFDQCEHFFKKSGVTFSKNNANRNETDARIKLKIKNRVAAQMTNIDTVCFDKFGIHLDEIPTHDKQALARLCLTNVPELEDYLRENVIAISPLAKQFLN